MSDNCKVGFHVFVAVTAALLNAACGKGGAGSNGAHSPAHVGLPPGLVSAASQEPQLRQPVDAVVAVQPVSPPGPAGETLPWTAVSALQGVQVVSDRDSVTIYVPAVAGAADYRVFALDATTQISATGSAEAVKGSDVFCAGLQQFNAPAPATPVVMRQIDVFNVTGPTRLVVEAVDTLCPFTGVRGSAPFSDQVTSSEVPPADRVSFGVYTEAALQQTYGALIFNGHQPGPTLAAPAVPAAPHVLARTTVVVTPIGLDMPPLAYFDDFHDDDQPEYVSDLPTFSDRSSNGQVMQNKRWSFYAYNYDHVDYVIDRGQLHTVLADRYQNVFATSSVVARRAVALDDDTYLHVRFTVGSDASQRRYWWIWVCGAATAGATLDAEGFVRGNIVNSPFFYQPDGLDPSVEGWNCFQLFPRDGSPFPLPPSNVRPQSDIRVMVNLPDHPVRGNVVNVSPDQYATATGYNSATPGWYRTQDSQGNLTGPILDDQMTIAPRATYDMYLKRDRVVLYVNGAQRLCNDFPNARLSMAEGALGFGQVLYHSTVERLEFSRGFDDRTGQQYYLNNTPYIDVRSWDNLGYQEHSRAPASFDPSPCYQAR